MDMRFTYREIGSARTANEGMMMRLIDAGALGRRKKDGL